MCIVYAIASQKGGVAKTTTTVNLGIALAKRGYRVLLIDGDGQGHTTLYLRCRLTNSLKVANLLAMEMNGVDYDPRTSGVIHVSEGVDLIPGNIETAGMELSLIEQNDREFILKKYVDKMRKFYDYILIDTLPSLGLMMINVLTAADRVIIPLQISLFGVDGLEQFIDTIEKVKKNYNRNLVIDGILITMARENTKLLRNVIPLIEQRYENSIRVFNSHIPLCIRVDESCAEGESVFAYDPKGKASIAYEEFTKEVCAL